MLQRILRRGSEMSRAPSIVGDESDDGLTTAERLAAGLPGGASADDADTGGGDPGDEDEDPKEQEPDVPVEPELPEDPAEEPPPAAAELSERDLQIHAAGRSEMASRITAVFASEHVTGREAAAAQLLAEDMAADRIVALLPKLSKDGSDMLAGLRGSIRNPDIRPGSDGGASGGKDGKSVWDRVAQKQGWADPKQSN